MWIVKNSLRATVTLKGLGVSIPAGAEFDLDAIGRDTAEKSPQVVVAFEEGYLANVFKAPREMPATPGPTYATAQPDLSGLVTSKEFEKFKTQFLDELRSQFPELKASVQAAADDMRQVAQQRIETEKRKILSDQSLSEAEMRLRVSFLEEKERELVKNFESVGQKVEREDGDVMDKADLLSGEI